MNDLIKTNEAPMPAYINKDDARGKGGMESSDLEIPYLKLMQHISTQVTEGIVAVGDVINRLNNEVIYEFDKEKPINSFNFAVIKKYKSWIKWENGTLAGFSRDPKSDLAMSAKSRRMVKNNKGVEVQEVTPYLCFICIIPEYGPTPVLMSWGVSMYKHGKRLHTLIEMAPGSSFAWMYEAKIKEENSKEGKKYLVMEFGKTGKNAEEDVYKLCASVYDKFEDPNINVTVGTGVDEDESEEGEF